ncbi:hypothetical protein [Sphingosinicella terrae]|uniref:hypothetical protein n=1 Tax=Sphingosinicella terrae TaxID=2172047 RepID=UPI0013B3E776|nr:hypothetical protein [Sphingosinicella terrae]
MADSSFTTADFHNLVHKQLLNVVHETLAESKLDWALVAPFLETARAMCRADFREGAQIRLHTVRADGDQWVEAEEAYLGIAIPDRDSGEAWLSETYWLSDVALADADPAQVRRIVAGLRRSIGKLEAWLSNEDEGPAADKRPGESGSTSQGEEDA